MEKQKNVFCNNKCQSDYMKNNSQELGLAQRANKMRESWDDKAWKKGLETRKKNGNIITEPTWKQYWKRCDYLTGKIRKQMLENWDGIDYIDGEYIKENLNLHYSDKNYPTLDHITPRSECFKRGLTPDEATNPNNLKKEALEILEEIKDNINVCCAITMEPDEVLNLLEKLEAFIKSKL
jgi:uncharacterized protein YnzC (UPF0291/DUF896 family)